MQQDQLIPPGSQTFFTKFIVWMVECVSLRNNVINGDLLPGQPQKSFEPKTQLWGGAENCVSYSETRRTLTSFSYRKKNYLLVLYP